MESAPTTYETSIDFNVNIELTSDKNNKYEITFKASHELIIEAIKKDIIPQTFINNFSVDKIRKNKYFYQFDTLNEICSEIKERIEKEKINVIEDTNLLLISIPLPSTKIKEIIFELNEKEKNDKEKINELTSLIYNQNKEIAELKDIIKDLKIQTTLLLKNYILNLDSLIITKNEYNSSLKNWINPKKKITANLLYRLSVNGGAISTYHELCDNKGPTLNLYELKEGIIIGFYIPSSVDSVSGWKTDNDTFIFNLNQNKKYKKTGIQYTSFYCGKDCGPSANCLGGNPYTDLKYIYHSSQNFDKYFEDGSKILNRGGIEKEYVAEEVEIFQINFE